MVHSRTRTILWSFVLLDLRTQYISTYYYRRSSMYKFIELFTTNNIITLNKLELFLINKFWTQKCSCEKSNLLRWINNFFLVSLSVHVGFFCLFWRVRVCVFPQLITVLCICMYGVCPCACVAYGLITVMLQIIFTASLIVFYKKRRFTDSTNRYISVCVMRTTSIIVHIQL